MSAVPSPRITARQIDALVAISAGAGTFHSGVGDSLETLGLAAPFATPRNIFGRDKSAKDWALTPEGVRAVAALNRKAA